MNSLVKSDDVFLMLNIKAIYTKSSCSLEKIVAIMWKSYSYG